MRFAAALTLVILTSLSPATAGGHMLGSELHAAAAKGDAAAIQELLAKGAEVDARDDGGRTALLIAAQANQVGAAREKIEEGAD
jgi:ankyrin repeat protein